MENHPVSLANSLFLWPCSVDILTSSEGKTSQQQPGPGGDNDAQLNVSTHFLALLAVPGTTTGTGPIETTIARAQESRTFGNTRKIEV